MTSVLTTAPCGIHVTIIVKCNKAFPWCFMAIFSMILLMVDNFYFYVFLEIILMPYKFSNFPLHIPQNFPIKTTQN